MIRKFSKNTKAADMTPAPWNADGEYEDSSFYAFDLRLQPLPDGMEAECTIEPQRGEDEETVFGYARRAADGLVLTISSESIMDLEEEDEAEVFEHYDTLSRASGSGYAQILRRLAWSVRGE